jgi:hypothetical protein
MIVRLVVGHCGVVLGNILNDSIIGIFGRDFAYLEKKGGELHFAQIPKVNPPRSH